MEGRLSIAREEEGEWVSEGGDNVEYSEGEACRVSGSD